MMLNTKKFLYILPDSAYVAEVLPSKKPHSFAIQAFRQINGSFIDENDFIAENIEKLIKKIEAEEYQLILPDFLFTNTIIDVVGEEDKVVKKYLSEKLLPSLNLHKETHDIETFILTQRQGKSKVQISALEKSLLAPLQKAAEEQKITISGISALSWSIKSIVSLEPSITATQIGSKLYVALQYIGVDQAISFDVADAGNVIETIKTLKGAEPSIQTLYLLSNALVENEIKEKLSGTLPIQQLSVFGDEQEGIPSYIKQIIQSAAKTFDIPEYQVPKFPLGKFTGVLPKPSAYTKVADGGSEELPVPTLFTPPSISPSNISEPLSTLPLPNTSGEDMKAVPEFIPPTPIVAPEPVLLITPVIPSTLPVVAPVVPPSPVVATPPVVPPLPTLPPQPIFEPMVEPPTISFKETPQPVSHIVAPVISTPIVTSNVVPYSSALPKNIQSPVMQLPNTPQTMPIGGTLPQQTVPPVQRTVIKNKGAKPMVKVILITLGALIATVAIGIGIGFAVLTLTDKKNNALDHNPVVQVASPTPTLIPSPSPSPSVSPVGALDVTKKTSWKILIVNATKTAGKAGKIKKSFTTAGYRTVDTGNAQGDYSGQTGSFALTAQNDPSVLAALQTDSGLTLTYAATKSSEDSNGKYDAVIVINQ